MKGSDFVQTYKSKLPTVWEAAVVDLFRQGQVPENPWVPIALSAKTSDGQTHSAIAQVSADYLTIGEPGDELRMPLAPSAAQEILNLDGSLLPTPWLDYQIWRQSIRLPRQGMAPNKGQNLEQYAAHNAIIAKQAAEAGWDKSKPLSGHKKDIVVGNLYKNDVVLIHGWYRPEPDVFKDDLAWDDPSPKKQPQQAYSNAHGAFYADYSHGARKVHPIMTVDGQPMATEQVYAHPELWRLVSHEGPVRTLRYPAKNAPATYRPASSQVWLVPTDPGFARRGLQVLVEEALKKVS